MKQRLTAMLAGIVLILGLGVNPAQAQDPSSAALAVVESAVTAAGDLITPPPIDLKRDKQTGLRQGKFAPKGNPGKGSTARTTTLLSGPPYFFYGLARQALAAGESATSLAANINIGNYYLNPADFHTLGQIAVQSHNSLQRIETGVTVDPTVCGAGNSPCLFVFWAKNGVGQCYNGCGFVPYATYCNTVGALCAGASLSSHVGTAKRFQIIHSGTAWWVAYNAQWIGYYPDTLFTASTPSGPGVTFTSGGLFQGFYEVAANEPEPCTDLALGIFAGDPSGTAARVGSISMTGTAPGTIANNFTASVQPVPSPTVYTVQQLSATTTRVGGPMWNAAGTAVGTTGGC